MINAGMVINAVKTLGTLYTGATLYAATKNVSAQAKAKADIERNKIVADAVAKATAKATAEIDNLRKEMTDLRSRDLNVKCDFEVALDKQLSELRVRTLNKEAIRKENIRKEEEDRVKDIIKGFIN